jgi:hypothetical protein
MASTTFLIALVGFLSLVTPSLSITDADILNFALNLECLEGEFYSWAAFGYGLNATLLGRPVDTNDGGMKASLSSAVQNYANEVAHDEINHVAFLRSALGANAVPCPTINVGSAFSAIVNAALGSKATSYNFSPYNNDLDFLLGAFLFEDVGVTAYRGAAPLIVNPTYLGAAASILAVEAYHAGIIRTLLFQDGAQPVKPYTIQTVDFVQSLSNLRAAVGGGADAGITSPAANGQLYVPYVTNDYASVLVPTDANSLAYARTPTQVLNIVYGGSETKPGAFFPTGVTGNIK